MPYNLNIRILESVSLTPFEIYWEKQKRKGGGRRRWEEEERKRKKKKNNRTERKGK